MTRYRIIASLIVVAALACAIAAQSPEDSIRRLDAGWARAYVTHDTAFAIQLFHESLLVTSGSGQLKNRDGELADIRAVPGMQMHYFRTTDVRVQVYASTGIVAGLAEWSFTANGQTSNARRRYTATYVRGGPLG